MADRSHRDDVRDLDVDEIDGTRESNAEDTADDAVRADAATARGDSAPTNGRAARSARVADVRLTGDRLVVRSPEDGERKTNSGLLIPATAAPAPKRLTWADVAVIGPDVRVAKVGDRVLFLPQSGLEVELDGEELVLLRERDVQAVSAPAASAERAPGQYL
jgi:chaperonin GroES